MHDKRHRRDQKRKAKKAEQRRREGLGPAKLLATTPGTFECYTSGDLAIFGQVQVVVHKRTPRGSGTAMFLIDRGIVGLKDAFVVCPMTDQDFRSLIEDQLKPTYPTNRITLEEARALIAGAVRFTREHGMRLPRNLAKGTSIVGGIGDWTTADTSQFVKEFAGHINDLRQRLIGEPFDEFIRRDDITFIFSSEAPYMDQKTGEYLNVPEDDLADLSVEEVEEIAADLPIEELNEIVETLAPAATDLSEQTTAWLAAQGRKPPVELFEAWRTMLLTSALAATSMPGAPPSELEKFGGELLESMHGRLGEERHLSHTEAIDQVVEHLETDPALMQRATFKNRTFG
jgi:hypothetical protein